MNLREDKVMGKGPKEQKKPKNEKPKAIAAAPLTKAAALAKPTKGK